MIHIYKKICCFCFFVIFVGYLSAQTPLIYNYPREFPVKGSFSIVQDTFGNMFFQGPKGNILIYDGTGFQKIRFKGTIYAFKIDSNGNILVGSSIDFGYIKRLKTGLYSYHSLSHIFTEDALRLPTVWGIVVKGNDIWLEFQNTIIQLTSKNEIYKFVQEFPASGSYWGVNLNEKICGCDDNDTVNVLFTIANREKTIIETNPDEAICRSRNMHSVNNNSYLILTLNKGIYSMDRNNFNYQPFHAKIDNLLIESNIYCSLSLRNGNIAIGTSYNGVIIIDNKGNLLHHFNEDNGLDYNLIHTLFEDDQENLWVSNGNSTSKIALGLPFIHAGSNFNIKDKVYDIIFQNDKLYIATNVGVFYKEKSKFKQIKGTGSQTWRMLPYKGGLLVAGGNKGVLYIEDTVLVAQQGSLNSLMDIELSSFDSTLIYCPTYAGLRIMKFINNSFHDLGIVPNTETDCRSIVEVSKDTIWLGARNDGFLQVIFPEKILNEQSLHKAKVSLFSHGIENVNRCTVYKLGDSTVFAANGALYYFQNETHSFQYANLLKSVLHLNNSELPFLQEDSHGNIWFAEGLKIFWNEGGNHFVADSTSLIPIGEAGHRVYQQNDSIMWIVNDYGIYCFNMKKRKYQKRYQTQISQVRLNDVDSILELSPENLPVLNYKHRSIVFEFSVPSYFNENNNLYQYILENYDKKWSAWTKNPIKEYTNLPSGTYTFRVKSQNSLGISGSVDSYRFSIRPPFYRSTLAYINYLIFLILLIYFVIKLYNRKLIRDNEKLENTVTQRTSEIISQKEEIQNIADNLLIANKEISTQKEQIEKQNTNITDSIIYASHIQKALFPNLDLLNKLIPDNFILYRPRDIVSGDFYDIKEINEHIIIIVGDCTGHGVPGALLSMLGMALINEIVRRSYISHPNELLNELRIQVKLALGQEDMDSHTMDGIDMAIAVIDKKNGTLEYSGAFNPMFLFRQKTGGIPEFIEFIPDDMPIGVHIFEKESFSNQKITIEPNDRIYLFSDGYIDQINAKDGKKFSKKKFRKLLIDIHKKTMPEQYNIMKAVLDENIGDQKQLDDVLVAGFFIGGYSLK